MRKREPDVASLQEMIDGQPADNGEAYYSEGSLGKGTLEIYRG